MGRRYSAILKYLDVDFIPVDQNDNWQTIAGYDSAIVATPTWMHVSHVRKLLGKGPILVEKPISTHLEDVLELCADAKDLRMVNQYEYLVPQGAEGETYYDYWNSGKDSIDWDCINIRGLATGTVHLGNESPIWLCQINGHKLSLADMDKAYIAMIESWLNVYWDNRSYIRLAHRRVVGHMH